jgi:L-lactate permease
LALGRYEQIATDDAYVVGGVMGKIIVAQSIVVSASTTGQVGSDLEFSGLSFGTAWHWRR